MSWLVRYMWASIAVAAFLCVGASASEHWDSANRPQAGGAGVAEPDPMNIEKLLLKAAESPVRVIVEFDIVPALKRQLARADPATARRVAIASTRAALMSRLDGTAVGDVQTAETLPLVAMVVGPDALERLANDPAVLRIEEDVLLAPNVLAGHEDFAISPSLADSVPLIGAARLHQNGIDGFGFTIAILDTGVDSRHPFLSGRVVEEACFSSVVPTLGVRSACPNGRGRQLGGGAARPCRVAGCEHGTHVAGIAAGAGQRFDGVAPSADIVAIQVFSIVSRPRDCQRFRRQAPCILSSSFDLRRALDHITMLSARRRIAAVNMSLGGGAFSTHCDGGNILKPPIDQLRAAGVATVIASGNSGLNGQISFPACTSSAVAVGSTSKDDEVSRFSNHADLVDLMAPGGSIRSSVPGGGFDSFNGTSMAAPHVAGAFALLWDGARDSNVGEIEEALRVTGVSVTRAWITKPRIQVDDALAALRGELRPANDDFADAIILSGTTASSTGTNRNATSEPGEPVHAGLGGGSSVWWRWTAPVSGRVRIDTRNSNFDTVLAVYRGSRLGRLREVASNDDARGTRQSAVTFQAQVGRIYRIAVDGYGGDEGDIALNLAVTESVRVRNDNFNRAIRLRGRSGRVTGTNRGATAQRGEPVHAGVGGGKSVWWKWRAPRSGRVTFSTRGSNFDTVLAVYRGSRLRRLREVASNDDVMGRLQSAVTFRARRGRIYRIAVDGYRGAEGDIILSFRQGRGRRLSFPLPLLVAK